MKQACRDASVFYVLFLTFIFTFFSDDGSLEFSMEVFQDKNFTSTLSNNIVPLGQTLYFQVEVDATGFGLNLHLERCWATPTDNSSHEDSFNLINNGLEEIHILYTLANVEK